MFVGRVAERQAIDRLLAGSRLGTSGALVISGEPGVGKTALLEHAMLQLEGSRVLRATGLEAEREIPFAGLLQLLRPTLHLVDTLPAAQGAALQAALALGGPPPSRRGSDRFAIGAAVLGLVCRYAEDGPVAVLVDDLHLLDAPSVEALVFATRRLTADPVVVLASARSPEVDELVTGLPVLPLDGLGLEDARELLLGHRGDIGSEERFEVLHHATAGNPLALLELAATDLGALDSLLSGLPLRVPSAVSAAFARRLDVLGAGCLSVLLTAAVCGGDLRTTSAACSRLGLDVSLLAEAEDARLVTVHGDRVEFRHPLLRAAAYSRATARDRQATHRAVAGVLPDDDVDRRAWHLSEATWHPDADVSGLLAEAGEHAVVRSAYSIGSTAFERSAWLSPSQGVRGELLLRAAEAAWLAGQGRRALALLDRHAEEPADAARHVVELELRAAIAARSGSLRAAIELLEAAADEAESADDAAVLVADAVNAAFYCADGRVCEALAERQAQLAASLSSCRARALGLMSTGVARIVAGHGGVDEIRAAVPLLESTPELRSDPRRLPWLMLAPLFLRDATSGTRLRALVEEIRGSAGVGMMPSVLFQVARDQATGDAWSQAEANYLEAIRLAAETGQATEEAMSSAGLAWLESRRGDPSPCREHVDRARTLSAGRDMYLVEAWASFALGDLALSMGHAEEAVVELESLADLLRRQGIRDPDLFPGPELTDALLRVGRAGDADAVASSFWEAATRKGQPWALARAERGLGLLARDEDVDETFAAALDLHARTLDRFETARTLLTHGERLRRAGRRIDARGRLRGALEVFERLGAQTWSDRAAAELSATGETTRRTGRGVGAALTPQELQVSLLLAAGRTTREAAAALFLSPKTVEYHLRKVYTKLGVRSRDELAHALAELTDTAQPAAAHEG